MRAGERIGDRFRLDEPVGRGGMGVVWRATDTVLERVVALKRVRLDGMDEAHAESARQRVLREARLAARLHHPAAITVFDVVQHEGEPWLVLEYMASRSLAEVLDADGPLVPAQAARVGAAVADALSAAHAAGVVHRDVKPANVLIGHDGTVKLTDFGIARAAGDLTLTANGAIIGTPAYFAPEVAAGGEPSPASDVFGLGATLYAAVEGVPPFEADRENVLQVLRAVADGRIRPPRRSGPLTDVLLALLDADPRQRPGAARARELLDAVGPAPRSATATVEQPVPAPIRPTGR